MNTKEMLLSKKWIIKKDNPEIYYKIKDETKELRKLFQDKFGYSLIVHNQYIKLDKIPGKAEPWMGIVDFTSIEEYQLFLYVLIYLEDMENEEQFILSSLTEYIQIQLKVNEEYWLVFSHRKMFVNVLKYCLKQKLIIQNDGNADLFTKDNDIEVLFENTGLSRYFMRNFMTDIFEWNDPEDFMQNEWIEESEDRGIVRRQRIYRRLLLSLGIYKEDEQNDDFSYIRHYRKRMENDFNQIFSCDLQVYHSSAYLILDEEEKVGRFFPRSTALDELMIVFFSQLRKGIKNKDYPCDKNEITAIKISTVINILTRIIRINHKYLPATYRQKTNEQLCSLVLNRAEQLGCIEVNKENITFYPVIGKLVGQFEEE